MGEVGCLEVIGASAYDYCLDAFSAFGAVP
jgi:hypothetical protein